MLPNNKGFKIIAFLIVIVFLLSAIPTQSVQALDIIYRVTPTGATSGTCGDTWANPCALQYAISLAGTGDQIWAAAGTYYPTTGTDRTISFNLKSGLAIYGGFAGTETELSQRDPVTNVTTLSGDISTIGDTSDNSYHVVYAGNVNNAAILDGFTITGGNANGTNPYDRGGGIYNAFSHPSIIGIIVVSNSTSNLGGGIYNTYSNPTMSNITVSNNATSYFGGGIYNSNSNPTITDSTIFGNSSQQRGGGMYNNLGSATLTNVMVSGNSSIERGGGMSSYGSNLTFNNVSFINNTSNVSGGGMYTGGGTSTISHSIFTNNSAPNGGGMLNSSGTTITLDYVTFENNTVSDRGGGMYNYSSDPVMTNITFSGNSAVTHGGGMFNSGSNPSMTDVTFTNNTSDTWGGGMDNNGSSPILINVTFSNNSADVSGGGLHNWEYSSPQLNNVLFDSNTAADRGGGMYVVDYCDFTLTDVTFQNNTSQGYGAGVFLNNSNPTFTRVSFINNSTPANGGGLYNSFTDVTLTDVTFVGNTAGVFGGGMLNNTSDAVITNVTFSGNTAGERGGGLFNYESNPTLTNLTFFGNSAVTYGGAIFNSGGNININASTIVENNADEFGGGIGNSGATTTLNNTLLWGNTAGINGSQIYMFSPNTFLLNDSVVQGGCPSGVTCSNIYTTDPLLGILGDNGGFTQTIPIAMGSSALDTANAATSPVTDQRGIARPKGYGDDIGAFELEWDPTVVELLSFSAERDGASVTLFWETATEFDNLGFNLYRAAAADGVKTLLNATLIPTNTYPGSLLGAAYSFIDPSDPDPRITYYYWLEDVNVHGYKTLHGPVEVVGDPGVFELVSFTAAPVDKNVVLTWVTTNEPDVTGYRLYRANDMGGKKTLLTSYAILSFGFNGGTYTFTDAGGDLRQGLKPNHTYFYWLEVNRDSDQVSLYGPVEVKTLPKPPPKKHRLPHHFK